MSDEKKRKKYRLYGTWLYFVLKIIMCTLKIKVIKSSEFQENVESYVFGFWHDKLVIPTIVLRKVEKRAVLASPSKDGELISVPLEKFGFEMIRGSSGENSTSSVLSLMRYLKKGYNIGTPLDGPKGPSHKAKPGMLYLAQKSGKAIIPIGGAYKSKWILTKTWDKFQIPKPFTTMVCILGEPIFVPKNGDIEEYKKIIEIKLNEIDEESKLYFQK
ncbi:lysophospholipid acyltransferase family protein [Fusobacterium sp. PH5-44]|uniref:lysophospholipid acyltransferase family protein n=1 Tax=unclassified Fusobacterium TaxID=2648384 RepID=UPI003D19AF22